MKFKYCIGNPPFQKESSGEKPSDESIYNNFMDSAYQIAEKVELITPARFLFNGGNTPTTWNKKMLSDEHFKVLEYEIDSKKIFTETDIKGGIAIHYRDENKKFGAINMFTSSPELNSILIKVKKIENSLNKSITDIIINQNKFNLQLLLKDYPKLENVISSDGKEKRMTSRCLTYDCFFDNKKQKNDIKILGVIGNKRVYKYIDTKYVEKSSENLKKYKVVIPANNGAGVMGESLSSPVICEPQTGYTQTFIAIGAFDNKIEAENTLKYVKSKFCRAMLSILKITQNGKKEVWKCVPIQNFTDNSDINWDTSVEEIDEQLFKKYNLSEEEINFIKINVKEMK